MNWGSDVKRSMSRSAGESEPVPDDFLVPSSKPP